MANTLFKFLNTNNEFFLTQNIKEIPIDILNDLQPINTVKSKLSTLTNLIHDDKSIKELQKNIINSIVFHQTILSSLNLPDQIDVNFTEINKANNIYNNVFNKNKLKSIGNTSTNLDGNNQFIHRY